jgi:hypothetical protein
MRSQVAYLVVTLREMLPLCHMTTKIIVYVDKSG